LVFLLVFTLLLIFLLIFSLLLVFLLVFTLLLVFLILGVVPLYLFLTIRGRRRSLIPYPPIQYKAGSVIPKFIFIFNTILVCLLLSVLFISLAKPYHATESIAIEERGIDIVLLVDVSASMQATDFNPNRLEATKKIISDFVRRSAGHRIGIVVFGKHVFTLSPLTTDHLVMRELIDGLSLNTIDHQLSGGTAIGDAMLRGIDILNNIKMPDRDQVLILLTDGDNNTGVDTELATKFAIDNDVRIYSVGLGSTDRITVTPNPNQPDWNFPSQLVEQPLKDIAEKTNGQYFHASGNTILNQIFQEISRLEQSPLEIDRIYQKRYHRYPLNVAISILFIMTLLIQVLMIRRPLK